MTAFLALIFVKGHRKKKSDFSRAIEEGSKSRVSGFEFRVSVSGFEVSRFPRFQSFKFMFADEASIVSYFTRNLETFKLET